MALHPVSELSFDENEQYDRVRRDGSSTDQRYESVKYEERTIREGKGDFRICSTMDEMKETGSITSQLITENLLFRGPIELREHNSLSA